MSDKSVTTTSGLEICKTTGPTPEQIQEIRDFLKMRGFRTVEVDRYMVLGTDESVLEITAALGLEPRADLPIRF